MLELDMAKSVNMVVLIGNLGNDPEVVEAQHGKIAKFSLATSEEWVNKESEKKFSRTDWHKIVVFNPKLISVVENFLKKGASIYVRGRLRTNSWVENDGTKRSSVEIEMLEMTMLGTKYDREEHADGGYKSADNDFSQNSSYNQSSDFDFSNGKSSDNNSSFSDEIPF
ncbi:MAG: single-stranded DNA-binding protein [Alphaproteobacteria bacterium]|nr:MAG: single-stranded DNA-binding protein [Alphaproteobacteria bacterium]